MKKIGVALACAACLACLASFVQNVAKPAGDDDNTVIAMRAIGHKLLLQAGDSTSTLLPVKKTAEGVYQLQFKQHFRFVADSLLKTIKAVATVAGLPKQYIVKVVNPNGEIMYACKITGNPEHDIISCLGRKQPAGSYTVEISYGSSRPALSAFILPSTGLLLAVLSGLMFFIYSKRRQVALAVHTDIPTSDTDAIYIGRFTFKPAQGLIVNGDETITLTAREIKLLMVFAEKPNTIIPRAELEKKVWEDEGVLVGGRTLDVFVSKLRKKLAGDASVNIANVHGLGYKLEVARG